MQTLTRERRKKFEEEIQSSKLHYYARLCLEHAGNTPEYVENTLAECRASLAAALADASASRSEVRGVEWAMFADRPVTKEDFPQALEDEALKAFETAMHCPGSWKWYPGKASDEAAWKELREAVVSIYQSDGAEGFVGYYSWSVQTYSRGAMTLLAIQNNPAGFALSWVAYQGSDAYRAKKTDEIRPVYRAEAEPKPNYVPAPVVRKHESN